MESNVAPPASASVHAHAPDRRPPPRGDHLLLHENAFHLHALHQRRPRVATPVPVGAVPAIPQDLRLPRRRNRRFEGALARKGR